MTNDMVLLQVSVVHRDLEQPERQETPGEQEEMGLLEQLETRDNGVPQGTRVRRDQRVTKETRDPRDHLAHRQETEEVPAEMERLEQLEDREAEARLAAQE